MGWTPMPTLTHACGRTPRARAGDAHMCPHASSLGPTRAVHKCLRERHPTGTNDPHRHMPTHRPHGRANCTRGHIPETHTEIGTW